MVRSGWIHWLSSALFTHASYRASMSIRREREGRLILGDFNYVPMGGQLKLYACLCFNKLSWTELNTHAEEILSSPWKSCRLRSLQPFFLYFFFLSLAVAIYTGMETKMALNYQTKTQKRSAVEKWAFTVSLSLSLSLSLSNWICHIYTARHNLV